MAQNSKEKSVPKSPKRKRKTREEIWAPDDDSVTDTAHDRLFGTKTGSPTIMQQMIGQEENGFNPWSSEINAIVDMHTLMGLYNNEDWVHIVVDKIASKISSQQLGIFRKVKNSKTLEIDQVHDHHLLPMLEQPNDFQDYHSFMYTLVAYYCVLGNAIINHQVVSKRLIPLPVENIHIRIDHKNLCIESYDVMGSSSDDLTYLYTRHSYNPKSVIHIRRPNPQSLLWGLSGFVPARKSVLFHRYSQEYLLNFYQKGAQPGIVIGLDKDANEKSAARLLTSWEKIQKGRKNQRKPMLLPKGATATVLDQKLADQQLLEYINQNRETIINIYGVPKHELSIAESGSLGSEEYRMALRNFWAGPLRTIQKHIAGALTRALKPYLGDGCYIDFDNSDVDVLQENAIDKANLATAMLETHTVNEVRAEIYKKDPIEGGDKLRGAAQQNPFGQINPFNMGNGNQPPFSAQNNQQEEEMTAEGKR